MLRPKQMSKVSVTGSKRVMEPVVETVHDLNLLHVSEYDGSWQGFRQGTPEAGAEDASEKLVTVRSIESILDIDPEDAGPTRIVTDDALEEELEDVRGRVNELDDRRDEVRDELRTVEERLDTMAPFVDLGVDLELLQGYDTLEVAVGEGDEEAVERALLDAEGVDRFDILEGDDTLAVFVYPTEHAEDVLEDALVGVEFAPIEVPDAEGAPESYVRELESEKQRLESELASVESDIEELKLDFAGFLFAAEEKLSIDVQKAEAPLSFATTENAFVAEGWIPTERYGEFASALTDELGDRVEVEEIERASFKSSGEAVHERQTQDAGAAATDGGTTMGHDEPPVIQDNPGVVQPFEVLVEAISRPSYEEFDPTVILFLTFPAFFGFMIGDLGYGLLYSLIGFYLYSNYESDAIRSMGGVTLAAGLFTMLFGVLYGEIFGLHVLGGVVWGGSPPLHKGLQPADLHWAKAWLLVSTIVALVHLNIGYVLGFLEELEFHGTWAALTEKGSWLLAMNGLWLFVFSRLGEGTKPDFLFEVFNTGESAAFHLGFAGFTPAAGWLGLALFLGGGLLLALGAPFEVVEIFDALVNVLSYTRLTAVLLAKAGMAFVVNLLFFGVAVTGEPGHEEWHFMTTHVYHVGDSLHGHEVTAIMFPGLVHGGIATLLLGLVVLVLGHLLVLALGVTSAGLQAVRLEYYEFFSKFYDGGGREYEPFGYERTYTKQD